MKKVAEAQSGLHKVEYFKSEGDDFMSPEAPKYNLSSDKPSDFHHHGVRSHKRAGKDHQISVLKHYKEEGRFKAVVHAHNDHSKTVHTTDEHPTAYAATKAAKNHIDGLE